MRGSAPGRREGQKRKADREGLGEGRPSFPAVSSSFQEHCMRAWTEQPSSSGRIRAKWPHRTRKSVRLQKKLPARNGVTCKLVEESSAVACCSEHPRSQEDPALCLLLAWRTAKARATGCVQGPLVPCCGWTHRSAGSALEQGLPGAPREVIMWSWGRGLPTCWEEEGVAFTNPVEFPIRIKGQAFGTCLAQPLHCTEEDAEAERK